MKESEITSAFRIINHDHRIELIAERYVKRKSLDSVLYAGVHVASIFRNACLDFLRYGNNDAATHYREQAEKLEGALEVLGMKGRITGDYVLDRMTQEDLDLVSPHFLSLMRGVNGPGCIVRAITSLAQMAIDLRKTIILYDRHAGNISFLFMLGRRFGDMRFDIPTANEAVDVFQILKGAVGIVNSDEAATYTDYDANTNGSAYRKSMRDGYSSVNLDNG
ncbi:hypothetical protein [Dyella caseinilytica]|uniref:HEPN domain-containing protein n=1 Tax=Dyella caseinilytica TaxID=1849581 RepID=A0ABX7GY28_9GAMM|nr:hypothetical protein [Dyella caseinilytica]QRN55391.1 hypothetical protein ISN74_08745 [Dyella caseinilytica]GGA01361.1 hypothetical protein GCM10011408_23310 [Dyella caseinilytica]